LYRRARARPAKSRLNEMVKLCKGVGECKVGEILDEKTQENEDNEEEGEKKKKTFGGCGSLKPTISKH
jgi:hypothetical protein